MAAAEDMMGEGVVVVGILPMGEITKTTRLTMTGGATTILTARETPVVTE
jgi:hypothetical protein